MAWSFRLRKAFVEDVSEPPQEEAKRRVQKVGQRNPTGGEGVIYRGWIYACLPERTDKQAPQEVREKGQWGHRGKEILREFDGEKSIARKV